MQVISLTIAGRYETQEIVFRTEPVVNSGPQSSSSSSSSSASLSSSSLSSLSAAAASQSNVNANTVSNSMALELLTQVNGIVTPTPVSASALIQDPNGNNHPIHGLQQQVNHHYLKKKNDFFKF